jgi:hypothetical protein
MVASLNIATVMPARPPNAGGMRVRRKSVVSMPCRPSWKATDVLHGCTAPPAMSSGVVPRPYPARSSGPKSRQ